MNSIRSTRVIHGGEEHTATVRWDGGVITSIDNGPADLDVGGLVISPGLVDTHVHVNEPGRTEWEGYVSATAAAAAGGTTTIVDMPLNSIPPTVDRAALAVKKKAARNELSVDTGFWGGIVPASNTIAISELIGDGVCGFKVFLADSGVPEFPPVTIDQLKNVLAPLIEGDIPLLVHAEDPDLLRDPSGDPTSHLTHMRSRPPEAETVAIRALVELSRDTGIRTHILHLASRGGVEAVSAARRSGLPISAETCPHYLFFDGEDVPSGATEYKCAPPLRGTDHIEALWRGLDTGVIDMVVSDHSPSPSDVKTPGDFVSAWGGISSLQLRLPIVWTRARERGNRPADLVPWLSQSPARLAGIDNRKGSIEPGADADLVVWDPDASFVVDANNLYHRHPVTPYDGETLFGRIHHTILRGSRILSDSQDMIPGRGLMLTP
ncbi:MAG: allantoinase AllB [Acidimicrobiia bacterium]|nr:allantoinase AllB [Acidimicrobiia bacterium]